MSVDSSMIIAYFLPLKSSIKSDFTEGEIMFFVNHVGLQLVLCILISSKVLPFACVATISPTLNSTVTGYAYGNLKFSHFQCITSAV